MPRVKHVQSARKAIPSAGIEVGDSYYWWKFRYGGKRVSKTYPKRSQLTQSLWSSVYAAQEELEEAKANADDLGLFDRIALSAGQRINGPSDFTRRLLNSLIISAGSTFFAVTLGLFAAYAFSRFDLPGKGDLLFCKLAFFHLT